MSEMQTEISTPLAAPIDSMTDAPTPMLPISEQARIVEAVLFAAPEPLSVQQLHAAIPGDADMGAALAELQEIYKDRGITLREIDGKWAFRTADVVSPHLYTYRKEEKKLSRAALETMAIIAYHQPITRTEIENIRGVAVAKGTIDILMELGWVKPGKRREIPGRPLTWLTTTAFLDHFGLEKLGDLPGMDDLRASGLLDTRPAIETIDMFGAEDAELKADAGVTDQDDEDDEIDLTSLEEDAERARVTAANDDDNADIAAVAEAAESVSADESDDNDETDDFDDSSEDDSDDDEDDDETDDYDDDFDEDDEDDDDDESEDD